MKQVTDAQQRLADRAVAAAAGLEKIGGASRLTATEFASVNKVLVTGLDAFRALGQDVPKQLQAMADAMHQGAEATGGWIPILHSLGTSWVARIAEGVLLRDAIREVINKIKEMATALPELALKGAAVADVEENFQHLTAQAGLLGAALTGELRTGTHNTITDFELMKTVNQDLAAGLNLTQAQFGTLAKGAFALAQATGTDVKTAFDTMNEAMLTGRTRALALLTGKIDLTAAEEKYAASMGKSKDNLTDAGKLESARAGILDAVTAATTRLGEQTDGLDERVAQAQVAWTNFTENLGKTIAVSKVLEAGMEGIKQALIDTFGSTQQTAIDAIVRKIDAAAISLVSVGEAGIRSASFIVKEWFALEKVFGNLVQVIDGVRLAFLLTQQAAAVGLLPGTSDLTKWKELDVQIGALEITMKKRGESLQEDNAQQAAVDATTAKYLTTLEGIRSKMVAARDAAKNFVGPLQDIGAGHERAGAAAGAHAAGLFKASEAEKKFAEALKEVTAFQEHFGRLVNSVDGSVAEGIKFYLARGAAVEKLATIYGLALAPVKALQEQMKFEEAVSAATAKAFGTTNAQMVPLIARYGDFHEAITGVDDETGLLNASLIDSGTATFNFADQGAYAAKQTEEFRKRLQALRAETHIFAATLNSLDRLLSNIGGKFAEVAVVSLRAASEIGKVVTKAHDAGEALSKGDWLQIAVIGVTALASAIGKLFGNNEEKKINPIREAFVQAAGGLDLLNQRAHDAGVTLAEILNAKNPEQYQKAIENLNAAFKFQDDAMRTLDATVSKYGFTIAQLGPAFKQQKLDEQAGSLIQDYRVLIASGIENVTVLEQMAPAMNDYLKTIQTAGGTIPTQLRAPLQSLLDLGLLTDSAGNKLTNLEGLTFAETLDKKFTTLIDTIQRLADAIERQLGTAIANIPDRTIHVGWNVDAAPDLGFEGDNRRFAASGGLVTATGIQHFGTGGVVLPFLPRGTDRVPAMLTPGEVVLNHAQQLGLAASLSDQGSRGPISLTFVLPPGNYNDPQALARAMLQVLTNDTGFVRTGLERIIDQRVA